MEQKVVRLSRACNILQCRKKKQKKQRWFLASVGWRCREGGLYRSGEGLWELLNEERARSDTMTHFTHRGWMDEVERAMTSVLTSFPVFPGASSCCFSPGGCMYDPKCLMNRRTQRRFIRAFHLQKHEWIFGVKARHETMTRFFLSLYSPRLSQSSSLLFPNYSCSPA